MMSGDDDAQIVADIKGGTDAAFDRIFDKYRAPVYSICLRHTRNDDDARELVLEIFIKVYRSIRDFDGRSKFFTWLYRIAVNTCISFHRKQKRNPEVSFERAGGAIGTDMERSVKLKMAIGQALEKVPPRQRMTFILRHYEGHTFNEIGSIMGITSGAAKAHFHQAVRKLRECLKEWL